MASGDEIRRLKAQLELQEQLAEAIKTSTENLDSFAQAQKKIKENYKLLKLISLELNALEKEKVGKTEEEVKEINKIQEGLKQQQKLLIGINQELAKGKNFAKAIGNEFIGWGKQLKTTFIPSLNDIFQKFLSIDDLTHQTANTLGFQGSKFKVMSANLSITRDEYAKMGYDLESAYKSQTALSEATGRQVMLSQEASKAIAETSRITGMAVEEMAGLAGQMEAFGLGAQQSADIVLEMSSEASQMGLNSGKVIKKFQENLGLLNKLNFKNGVKGLKEMSKFSEKFKLDMNAVASVADKVFRPEGAIEAAAQLQVLGGSLAALGDPFQLMYKARNSPEELAKSLTKAASASATFDKATGEWKVNAYELDRMKEAANALGMDYQQLVETAKQGAKIKQFEGLLGGKGLSKEEMDALTGAAQMGKKGAFVLDAKGAQVLLKDATKEQAQALMNDVTKREELAEKARSLDSKVEEIKNRVMIAGVKIFEKLEPLFHKLLDWGKVIIDKLDPKYILGAFLAFPLLQGAFWVLKGRLLGMGFNSAVSTGPLGAGGEAKKGMLGRFVDKLKFWKKTPAMPESTSVPTNPSGTAGAGGANPGGMTKGINTTDMIKGAAAIVILSAALWVFAKSLQEFDKVNNKGETILMAAAGLGVLGTAAFLLSKVEKDMIKGAFAIGVLSLAMIPLAFSLNMMKDVGFDTIGVLALGLTALGVAGFVMGMAAPEIILGAIAIGALGLAVIPLAYAFTLVADGISTIVNSFTQMFSVIGPNGASLMMAGVGFMAMAAGVGILTISLIALGAASLLALPGLMILGSVTSMLTETASALQATGGGDGISKTVDAINRVDMDKLQALKDLSVWLALLGGTTTVKFDESLTIDGSIEIAGSAGGKKDTDWINDPIFISNLKKLIASSSKTDRNGGTA